MRTRSSEKLHASSLARYFGNATKFTSLNTGVVRRQRDRNPPSSDRIKKVGPEKEHDVTVRVRPVCRNRNLTSSTDNPVHRGKDPERVNCHRMHETANPCTRYTNRLKNLSNTRCTEESVRCNVNFVRGTEKFAHGNIRPERDTMELNCGDVKRLA